MRALEGWKSKALLDLLARTIDFRGRTPKKLGMEWGGGDIPALSANNVEMGKINFSKECYLGSNALYRKWMTKGDTRKGDIVLTTEAPLGNVAQIPDERRYILSQRTILLRANEAELLNDYLKHYLTSAVFQKLMRQEASGTTATGIQRAKLETLPVKFPTLKTEQIAIAKILSTVDQAIEQTEVLIAKRQRIKTGLMQDLLTRGIDEQGNLRSESTHKFKDSVLGRIPVEWEVMRLGSLLENINQGWSPDCEPDPAGMGEWGVLKTTAVVWQGYQDNENKALPPRFSPRLDLEIKPGDLLMTRAGPNSRVGVSAYVYQTRSRLMLSDKIYRLVSNRNVEGRYLCYAISGSRSQRHLSNLKTGMAESQTNISQDIVKSMLTVCPSRSEQALIADHLDYLSVEFNRTTASLVKLHALKRALMQALLTGNKRVTPLLELQLTN